MKTLHKGTARELLFTMKGNEIIVETQKEVTNRIVKQEQRDFIIETLCFMVACITLGSIITLTLTN